MRHAARAVRGLDCEPRLTSAGSPCATPACFKHLDQQKEVGRTAPETAVTRPCADSRSSHNVAPTAPRISAAIRRRSMRHLQSRRALSCRSPADAGRFGMQRTTGMSGCPALNVRGANTCRDRDEQWAVGGYGTSATMTLPHFLRFDGEHDDVCSRSRSPDCCLRRAHRIAYATTAIAIRHGSATIN